MIRFETILCATDLSVEGDEVVRQADAFARAHQARLVVFHALPHAVASSPLFPQAAEVQSEAFVGLERHVLRLLSERVAVLTSRVGSEVELQLGSGTPHSAIIAQAEATKADLIVVGGAGPKGALRAMLGAVAERVVRYAHCPVLVARPAGDGPIIVGTDFSKSAAPAVEVAAHLAKQASVPLRLVHALAIEGQVPYGSSPSSTPAFPVWSGEDIARLRTAAEAHVAEVFGRIGAAGVTEVADAKPGAALVAIAERERARLICVGNSGHTGLARVLLGSVAEEVVRKAHCPVLVARH